MAETIIKRARSRLSAMRVAPPSGPVSSRAAADEFETLANLADEMLAALNLVATDYRTEGCPDSKCIICQRSHAAEKAMNDAIAKAEGRS